MNTFQNIRREMKEFESAIVQKYGVVVRLDIDFVLPEYARVSVSKMAAIWNIKEVNLFVKHKSTELVTMRQVVMLYLREVCRLSLPLIGKYMDIDHTTVLYGLRKCAHYLAVNDVVFYQYYEPVKHLFNEEV